jgi:hypothetical protein
MGAIVGILAVVVGALGAFYAWGQLREARRIREDTQSRAERQQNEDDVWSEKFVEAGQRLCRLANMDHTGLVARNGRRILRESSLGLMFGDDVYGHILGLLIQQQDDQTFALRPIDVAQLRLRANRELIAKVLRKLR